LAREIKTFRLAKGFIEKTRDWVAEREGFELQHSLPSYMFAVTGEHIRRIEAVSLRNDMPGAYVVLSMSYC
jgi:hypothetical protein